MRAAQTNYLAHLPGARHGLAANFPVQKNIVNVKLPWLPHLKGSTKTPVGAFNE